MTEVQEVIEPANLNRTKPLKSKDSSPHQRIAIFSDIHGNLQALQAVLNAIDELEIREIYCCGDIVGYGGNPNECADLIRRREIPTVLGNHDQAALGELDISNFNEVAKSAIVWTQEQLSAENREFLKTRPMQIELEDVLLVHASPRNPDDWNYILTVAEARLNFEYFDKRICCIGHSHQPFIIENNGATLSCPAEFFITIHPEYKYLINVGSVGQPRDRIPDACLAVLDRTDQTLEIKRIAYDVQAAQSAITTQGLPEILAIRLASGN